ATRVVVWLDGREVAERLKDLRRVEAARMAPAEIARRLAETIRRRHVRTRIAEASQRGAVAMAAAREKEIADTVDYPAEESLTRGSGPRLQSPPKPLP